MTFLSPWAFLRAYTALSLAMIFLVAYRTLLRHQACSYVSGVLLVLCATTNPSLFGCFLVQPRILLMAHWWEICR